MNRASEYRKDKVQALYDAGFRELVVCGVGEVEARDARIAELEAALTQQQEAAIRVGQRLQQYLAGECVCPPCDEGVERPGHYPGCPMIYKQRIAELEAQQQEAHTVEYTAAGIHESYYKCSCGTAFRVDTEDDGGSLDCPAQQQEAEPEGWLVERIDGQSLPYSPARTVLDAKKYNPMSDDFWIKGEIEKYKITPLHPPKTAAQPQVPEGWKVEPTRVTADGLRITDPDGYVDAIYPESEIMAERFMCAYFSAEKEES